MKFSLNNSAPVKILFQVPTNPWLFIDNTYIHGSENEGDQEGNKLIHVHGFNQTRSHSILYKVLPFFIF